jgi:hypothetical protein
LIAGFCPPNRRFFAGRKEKTGLVSQGMAEEAGEFRMSTT